MEALSPLIQQYLAFGVPIVVIEIMTIHCYVDYLDDGHKMAIKLGLGLLVRFVLVNFMLWVPWKRGPKCWLIIAPTLYYILNVSNYIILPIGTVIWFATHAQKVEESVYGLYMMCVCIIWALQIVFYFTIIRPYVYFNAKAYLASRKEAWAAKELAEQ